VRVGSYEIESALGGGLFEARHFVLPRRAVIKTVPEALGWVKPLRVALLREACILEALAHPGVARLYETGRFADGRPWFAFEDVEGIPLSEAGTLALPALITLLRDLADVLEHAHSRGVVHAGLHPDRIVLTPRAFGVCLEDWSSARTHDAVHSIPHVPTPVSRAYLAPEQLANDRIDDRADIFALGAIARRALPSSAPAALGHLVDQMMATARGDRPSIREVREMLAAIPVAISRPRWTPPLGLQRAPAEEEIALEDVVLVELD
jgi:serine/threonine-protein kinase